MGQVVPKAARREGRARGRLGRVQHREREPDEAPATLSENRPIENSSPRSFTALSYRFVTCSRGGAG
jgi:hypothetical protein